MPKVMINGREVFLPDDIATGKEIRTQAGIPDNRALIRQSPEGNTLVCNDQSVELTPDSRFISAPTFEYGR